MTGPLPAGTDVARLVGNYRLTMVAIRGPAAGRSAHGTLTLRADIAAVRGHAAIPLDSVGAHRPGNIASQDPVAPGVLALPQEDAIFLRFGADANRKDVQAFEGPYMVLHVRRVDAGGLFGTWASGAERTDAEGHFCAVPMPGG